jgi:hypothetical protein
MAFGAVLIASAGTTAAAAPTAVAAGAAHSQIVPAQVHVHVGRDRHHRHPQYWRDKRGHRHRYYYKDHHWYKHRSHRHGHWRYY